ncbi:hypothetical protein [uncultured Stenotrophomonas sp.]|uniref:hypothetical protein n=1 Tax=uncultured Stenotrophomonas sp. TaxID=165438 RepID=UPI0025D6AF33|nr:hypothetical protein [uncultured Stenotrophomonas sp.]
MPPRPALRPGVITGLILLACWLGWTTRSVAALAHRPGDDEAAVAALVDGLRAQGQLPAIAAPLAIRLTGPACNCMQDEQAWQQLSTALQAQGAHTIALGATGAYELLVLAADGHPLYAGPLQPSALACGRGNSTLASWLPALLAERNPPLFLPPRCSC